MKHTTTSDLEALQNAINYHNLPKMNLSIHEKCFFEDKRKTVKMFFLHNDKTGETISPVLNYENMNHFILGFARAKKMFAA